MTLGVTNDNSKPTQASSFSSQDEKTAYLPWVLALLACYIIYSGTPWGLGLTPDAVAYVHSVGLLRKGWQMAQLPAHWPPGYPLVLALAERVFGDLLTASRIVQGIAAAISVLLLFRLLERLGFSVQQASVAVLLLLVQPGFLDVHLMMWSEPVFFVFVLLDLLALHRVIRSPGQASQWLILGLACGAAIMVRYAGVYLIPLNAFSICCLASSARDWRQRVLAATTTASISILPLLSWLGFNHGSRSGGSDRVLAWHPLGAQEFSELGQTVADWFHLPGGFGVLMALAILLALILSLLSTRSGNSDAVIMRRVVSLNVLFYLAFLWVSISFLDNYTPLDYRILFPVFPFCVASLAILITRILAWPRNVSTVMTAFLVAVMCVGSYAGWQDWRHSRTEGNFLSNRGFQEMPVLRWLRSVPGRFTFATNGPELFEIYLQREAKMLPEKFSPTSRIPRRDYPRLLDDAMAHSDVVVYFQPMAGRTYLATPEEIDGFAALRRIYAADDAIVWVKKPTRAKD